MKMTAKTLAAALILGLAAPALTFAQGAPLGLPDAPVEESAPAEASVEEHSAPSEPGECPRPDAPQAEALPGAQPTFLGGSCHAECFEVFQQCTVECPDCPATPLCGAPCYQQCSIERNICTGACSV